MNLQEPSFTCHQPLCLRRFNNLDRLLAHAKRDHAFVASADPSATPHRPSSPSPGGKVGALTRALTSKLEAAATTPLPAASVLAAYAAAQWCSWTLQRELRDGWLADTDAKLLEGRPWGYVDEEVARFFRTLGTDGGRVYARLQSIESLATAPLTALVLSMLCILLVRFIRYPSLKPVSLLPFVLPATKSVEATLLASLLQDYFLDRSVSSGRVVFAASLTLFKIRIVLPLLAGLAVSLLLAVPVKWILKVGEERFQKTAQEYVEEFDEYPDQYDDGDDDVVVRTYDDERSNDESGSVEPRATSLRDDHDAAEIKSPVAKKTD